jgi:alpha-mannosidase
MYRILIRGCLIALGLTAIVSGQAPKDSTAHKRTLGVVATSHLDTQWRWTIQNTINEYVLNTLRDNFKLLDLYPHYTFSFEGAFRYMLAKEYYPEEYQKLKTYIANGRWRVAGGWVDAVDVNMPSFESLTRHALYGNGFYKQEFGKTSRDILLPDCFGFGYALPSIAVHTGLKSFSTQKLSWGSSVKVPYDIGTWQGVDGSMIVAALKPGDYVAKIKDDLSRDSLWKDHIDREGAASGLYAGFMYFGTGDVGGSPESSSVAWLEKSIASDGPITVKSIGSDDLADLAASQGKVDLPNYRGELLMTRHGVGCYSSEAAMKRWNRKNELLADAAERASVIANMFGGLNYPKQTLKETWIRFLWHQFHDDLTGTSIPQAYEFSWSDELLAQNRFAGILTNAVEATTPMLDTRAVGTPIVVYNPLAIGREDIVEATIQVKGEVPNAVQVVGPNGKEAPSQIAESYNDSLKVVFLASVPSVGYAVYDVRPSERACRLETGLKASPSTLENERYTVKLNDNGDIASIYDKMEKVELLKEPITFQMLFDKPKAWPAWEILYEDIMGTPKPLADKNVQIKIVDNGRARVAIEVTRRTEKSVFRTVISLAAGAAGDRVVFDNSVDWYERETLLKAAFKLNMPNDSITYDIGLGTIRRGINAPEKYEVPAHQWADMTSKSGTYGVAVLSDCKYGWDHPDSSTLRLSLIHTPGVHENWSWVGDQSSQDNGHHRFAFAVAGHRGDWREGSVPWQAARFNEPLVAFQTPSHKGALGKEFSLVTLGTAGGGKKAKEKVKLPQVYLNAIKLAENSDEVIVRFRELNGVLAENVQVRFSRPIVSAREVNGAEDPMGGAQVRNGALVASFTPYQPRAFALTFASEKSKPLPLPKCQPLTLAFDLDAISTDDNRTDGDFDGNGNTIAGELLPDTLTFESVPFVFGPKAAGMKNAVICNGQSISLPVGSYNQLYLLAASMKGWSAGEFIFDKGTKDASEPFRALAPDYSTRPGQWNNRLVADQILENPEQIAPAYINHQQVGWFGTHRHTAKGENEAYRFTYLYLIRLNIPSGARTLTLPPEPRLRLFAATVANANQDQVRAAQPLYDVTNSTLANITAERIAFLDSTVVRLGSPVPGAVLRYTLDSSEPTMSSLGYTQPIQLAQTTTVKARALLDGADDSHVTSMTFTRLIPYEPKVLDSAAKGLMCAYYEGDWTKLPKFDSLIAVQTSVLDSVFIPGFSRKEGFGLVFTGYVKIPWDGLWKFSTTSDDGSKLWVEDSLLVDNDGIHGDQEISGEIALKAGLHPVTVQYFQGKGGLSLSMALEGSGFKYQALPSSMLFHAVEKPAKGKKR